MDPPIAFLLKDKTRRLFSMHPFTYHVLLKEPENVMFDNFAASLQFFSDMTYGRPRSLQSSPRAVNV